MPIPRNLFHQNPDTAMQFLESRRGLLVHELGHFVAANVDGLVSGHMIIEDREGNNSCAALQIASVSRPSIERDPSRRKFVASAGALTEMYFCNASVLRRIGPDIQNYFGYALFRGSRHQAVAFWSTRHLDHIERYADCIDANYDRCIKYLASDRYLIDGYHVIPSSALVPPRPRSIFERLDDRIRTASKRARRSALKEYLADLAEMRRGGAMGALP